MSLVPAHWASKLRRIVEFQLRRYSSPARAISLCRVNGRGFDSSLGAAEIVRQSLKIAGEIDIYTNTNIVVEELESLT